MRKEISHLVSSERDAKHHLCLGWASSADFLLRRRVSALSFLSFLSSPVSQLKSDLEEISVLPSVFF